MKSHESKKEEEKEVVPTIPVAPATLSELDELRALWDKLKALGINSISDLEVKIARLSK